MSTLADKHFHSEKIAHKFVKKHTLLKRSGLLNMPIKPNAINRARYLIDSWKKLLRAKGSNKFRIGTYLPINTLNVSFNINSLMKSRYQVSFFQRIR